MIKIASLFSGIGGFELGIKTSMQKHNFDSQVIWMCEKNKFCRQILKKNFPNIPVYEDIKNLNLKTIESPDIMIGGFPCQDVSNAGLRKGIKGEKSGLFFDMSKIICELRPEIVIMENVASLINRGIRDVLGTISQIGYDAEWTIISAKDFGAPHLRKRIFIVAYPECIGAQIRIKRKFSESYMLRSESPKRSLGNWKNWPTQSGICRRDDGIPYRVDRIKSLGNAIVPQCSEWVFDQIIKNYVLK